MKIIMLCYFVIFLFGLNIEIYGRQVVDWEITDGYKISFSGRGAEGTIYGLNGIIRFDQNKAEEGFFDMTLDLNGIETGNKTKNKHAKGKSWLYVIKFPNVKFKSKKITKNENGLIVIGDLTLHGVRKEIRIPFTFSENGKKGLFKGKFNVDRTEFDVLGPFFGFAVSDLLEIKLEIPVRRP